MAGRLRNMALYLGLVDADEQDEYYDEGFEEGYDEPAPSRAHGQPSVSVRDHARGEPVRRSAGLSVAPDEPRVARVAAAPAAVVSDPYRITTVQPSTYNEARVIGEHFRGGTPVIINLTDMDDADAKRLVDFAAGLIFGLRGSIERVTNKVFLLSPSNVEVSAEDKARIAESGFFNQS
ncbi:MAG TPA: cell division protein SepF [Mycobacteriales bacterium]